MSIRTPAREFPDCLDQEDADLIINVESIVALKREMGAEAQLLDVIQRLMLEIRRREINVEKKPCSTS